MVTLCAAKVRVFAAEELQRTGKWSFHPILLIFHITRQWRSIPGFPPHLLLIWRPPPSIQHHRRVSCPPCKACRNHRQGRPRMPVAQWRSKSTLHRTRVVWLVWKTRLQVKKTLIAHGFRFGPGSRRSLEIFVGTNNLFTFCREWIVWAFHPNWQKCATLFQVTSFAYHRHRQCTSGRSWRECCHRSSRPWTGRSGPASPRSNRHTPTLTHWRGRREPLPTRTKNLSLK